MVSELSFRNTYEYLSRPVEPPFLTVFTEGKYWDLIELSMLEHEWRERQRQITSKAENA